MGAMNRKIIVVPWIVKSWLNSDFDRNCRPGRASSVRISNAMIPPRRKNPNVVTMYSRPICLWFVVVSQSRIPSFGSFGSSCSTPTVVTGASRAGGERGRGGGRRTGRRRLRPLLPDPPVEGLLGDGPDVEHHR